MNEEENSNQSVDITDDLEDFENQFYGKTSPSPEAEADEPKAEVEDETEVDDLGEDDNPPASEDDEDEPEAEVEDDEDEEEPEPQQKKSRKNRVQERINELTAKARQEEREKLALLKRIEELEASVKTEKKPEEGVKGKLPTGAPNPDAKDADGTPLYALGEFDPEFIRDLTKFTIAEETKAAREVAEKEAAERAVTEAKQQLGDEWIDKLDKYEETVDYDVRENIRELTDTFASLEPQYGEYLALTIMASEVGPQMMDYLSQNIGEAQRIVASGPAAATLALGRLEAKLIPTKQDEQRRNKKVSKAPEPPVNLNRGSGGRFTVAPDTDDLSAFEKEFYKK